MTGTNIYVYKVDWKGKSAAIVEEYLKKPIKEESIIENASLMADSTGLSNMSNVNSS